MSAAPPLNNSEPAVAPSTDPSAALGHIYAEYYGLSESPFAITPDPRFLFMSQRHRDALAHLLFAVKQGGGFVQLTGEVGTGKTTLTRALLAQLPPNVNAAIVLNPKQTALEFVQSICDELGVPRSGDNSSIKALTDALNTHLLVAHTRGERTLVLIDEAQNLEIGVLEQIRLLTNLETTKEKLLQIILVGQPELRLMLDRKDLRQLAQRITARYHLLPLSERETAEMVKHRLAVAGFTQHLFSDAALRMIHRASKGVPRIINVISDRALLGAYSENQRVIDRRIVLRATAEVLGDETAQQVSSNSRWIAIAIGVVLIGSMIALGVRWMSNRQSTPAVAPPAASSPVAPAATPPVADETAPVTTVIPAAPQAPTAVPADFAEAMHTPGIEVSLDRGMSTLLALWSKNYATASGMTPCDRAVAFNLYCTTGTATISQLKSMNHPALLKLETASGANIFAVIARVNGTELELRFGNQVYLVGSSELQPFWRGDSLVVWARPSIGTKMIAPGMQGSSVRWLSAALNRVEGSDAPAVTEFDAALKARVKSFQSKMGLPADGIAGEQTMIALLGAVAETGQPRLMPPAVP